MPRFPRPLLNLPSSLMAAAFLCLASLWGAGAHAQDAPKTLLIPGFKVVGDVDPTISFAVVDLVSERLSRSQRYSVISGDDLSQMLDIEAQRQLAGCDDDSCVAEIAGSLNADTVLFGRISRLGDVLIVRMTFFDTQRATAESRVVIQVKDEGEIPQAIDIEMSKFLGQPIVVVEKDPPPVESGFPYGIAGLSAVGVSTGIAIITVIVAGTAAFLAATPRGLINLDTKGVNAARTTALVTVLLGLPTAVTIGAAGGALFVVELIE